jgi:hypothetical protein
MIDLSITRELVAQRASTSPKPMSHLDTEVNPQAEVCDRSDDLRVTHRARFEQGADTGCGVGERIRRVIGRAAGAYGNAAIR